MKRIFLIAILALVAQMSFAQKIFTQKAPPPPPGLNPTISSFLPATICTIAAQSITIVGTSLSQSTSVLFTGPTGVNLLGTITAKSDSSLTVTTHANIVDGVIRLSFSGGSIDSASILTVTPTTTPTFTQVAAVCSGAVINALPTTSTNGITGSWSPSISNLATTNYTFTPDASQCATTATQTIIVNVTLTPTVEPQTFCASATAANLVATGTDLKWYTSASGGTVLGSSDALVSGTYYVSQSINGCESERTSIVVTINPELSYYADADNDGYGIEPLITSCIASVPTGYSLLSGDCNDTIASINPDATETINRIDDNCNGTIDEGNTPSPTEVAIGTQTWTTKNLDVATYSDSTVIPEVTNPTEWANLTTGAWCYYNNDAATGATYGKLYNWYAVAGIYDEASKTDSTIRKRLVPKGYHVPSENEWTTLTDYLGGASIAGGKLKETGTAHWASPNTGATNSIGFAGLPGGFRLTDGTFSGIGNFSSFYYNNNSMFINMTLSKDNGEAFPWGASSSLNFFNYGCSVRCVRDFTSSPTANAQTFCGATTVASLVATGTDLKWYAAATGGTALASDVVLASGTYYVSQNLNNLESDRTPVGITITTPPNAGIVWGTQALCSDGTTTFGSTVSGGVWTSGSEFIASIDESTGEITPVAAGASTITYTVLGDEACPSATATRTVIITAAPNAGTLSGTQEICSYGTTIFLSNGSTAGKWSSSDTGIATINSTIGLITPQSAGEATMTYTVTGSGGCADATATRTVIITLPVSAGELSGTQELCSNGLTTFISDSDSASDSAGFYKLEDENWLYAPNSVHAFHYELLKELKDTYTYPVEGWTWYDEHPYITDGDSGGTWTSSDTAIATINASTGVITPVAAGTSTITYTITGSGGCANATATRTVTVNPSYTFYADADTDGYGARSPVSLCAVNATTAPTGYSVNNTDCDDTKAAVRPGATEIADGLDNNCNGLTDEHLTPTAPEVTNTSVSVGATSVIPTVTAIFGYTLQWYTVATKGTALATAPTVITTAAGVKSYWVSQKYGAFTESPRVLVTVTIVALPATPGSLSLFDGATGVTSLGSYVGSSSVLKLTTIAVANATYKWTLPDGVFRTDASGNPINDTSSTDAFINVMFSPTTLTKALVVGVQLVNTVGGISKTTKTLSLARKLPYTLTGLALTTNDIVGSITKVGPYMGVDKDFTLTATAVTTQGVRPVSYKWVLPAGVTASGNATLVSTGVYTSTLPSITVNFKGVTTPAVTSLPINAYAVNGVGTSATRLLNLSRALPKVVSSVTGSALVCNRPSGFNYTILATDGATKYLITAPTNSVVSSASNTTNTSNTLTTSDLSFNVVYTGAVTVSTKQTLTIKSMNGAGTATAKSIALTKQVSCTTLEGISKVTPVAEAFKVVAYPNPATSVFTLDVNLAKGTSAGVQVYDMAGRLIEKLQIKSGPTQLGANYPSGTYILKVSQGKNLKSLQVIKR